MRVHPMRSREDRSEGGCGMLSRDGVGSGVLNFQPFPRESTSSVKMSSLYCQLFNMLCTDYIVHCTLLQCTELLILISNNSERERERERERDTEGYRGTDRDSLRHIW